ncbi:hypothetical protein HYX11_01310 [Candidatus Woesearchaeota archaeon]|nr:hypothetical protein [Candidatus Woesearchaeota archaeon]
MVLSTKRGQAAAAAVLLAIVAGLIIMFIVLMPPAERAQLLGESKTTITSTSDIAVTGAVLFKTSPGRIDYFSNKDLEHTLSDINIFTKTESKIIAEKNSIYAKRSLFSKKTAEFSFKIKNLGQTDNVLLSFMAKNAQGRVIITLNSEEIYNGIINTKNVKPIALSKSSLKDDNLLVFSLSSPGLAFWRTNELVLEDIKTLGDITSLDTQYSKNVFLVSDTEKKNMEKMILKLYPECQSNDVGRLTIKLNTHEIYNNIPDCSQTILEVEIAPEIIVSGENALTFSIEQGAYLLTHPKLQTKLKEIDYPTYYFDIPHEQFNTIKDKTKKVRLTLNFVDITDSKQGEFLINANIQSFDTKDTSFIYDMSNYAVEGNNAIKIKPKRSLDVRELRVELIS